MADEDPGKDGPSLELPSLSFGRKRRKKGTEPSSASPAEPVRAPLSEPAAPPEVAPVAEPARAPVEDSAPQTVETQAMAPAPPPPPLFVDEVGAGSETTATAPIPAPTATATATATAGEPASKTEPQRRQARPRRELPAIGGMAAAVVTGLLVGIITVGLTWASLRLCEVTQGTSSCGGPGLLLLIAIMIAMIFLGSLLLRAWGVPDPGSTSFLAVGLLAVLSLLFLVDVLFNWWMIIAIPLFSVLTFALSHWVTTAFIEPAEH